MEVDVLIIGQGICGTMLSWFLQEEGKSFHVIDDNKQAAPSKVAAGIINPVTGRRFVYSWMIDELLPFALNTYGSIGTFLRERIVEKKDIIDFFPSAQMRDAFVTKMTENDTYLHTYPNQNQFNQYFHLEFGCGKISPACIVDLSTLLLRWRTHLMSQRSISETNFDIERLEVQGDSVVYDTITANKIVFCDGIASMNYQWFKSLPFSPSKGEALIIEAEELTNEHVFKKGMMLAPLFQPHLYWVGSSYQWEYEHEHPSQQFLQQTKAVLNSWLKVPYKIVDHKAALRPSTLERRPFVGFHPQHPSVGILNGMGTKGSSLAPFFAHQLVQNICFGSSITNEANVQRFSRILSK
jgi:glycine/D-amino acid oxidase-like deaminating enzyme